MPHPSFRTTLLASFLLIACIVGAAAVSAWLGLEHFARASRDGKQAALGLSAAIQQLGERTVDMERSARQYLVLGDAVLRERFVIARDGAFQALADLDHALPAAAAQTAAWRALATQIETALDAAAAPPAPRAEPPQPAPSEHAASARNAAEVAAREPAATAAALAALGDANARLAETVRDDIERHNSALLDTLDRKRERLARQLLGALGAACALAALTAWWVLRPLQRILRAISALGDSRFDAPIEVGGPSDLRRLGQRLDWLRLRLADLEAHRSRVLRHVSHELKTPLASLREGVALLDDGVPGGLTGEQREVTRILDHNVRLLQERIEQLLDYNATQFDARHLDLRLTALRPLATAVIAEQTLQAQARGVSLEVAGEAPLVLADAAKLRITLSNLVANAIAFSPPGGEVRLSLGTHGDTVRIDCTDQGPGVLPEEAERIFDPFVQGSRSAQRSGKGNGLGLAIVREFVTAHGGRVAALDSARGAHFRIELPHAP